MTARSRYVEVGQQFGRGTVIYPEVPMSYKHRTGVKAGRGGVQRGAGLRCSCGNEYISSLAKLLSGGSKSCGCLQREQAAERLSRDNDTRALAFARKVAYGDHPFVGDELDYGSPEYQKWYGIWAKYHVTRRQWKEMFAAQEGRCALCREPFPEENEGHPPHMDHNHACCPGKYTCGKCIRGLLCHGCNRLLGWVEKVGLPAVSSYLAEGG